MAIAAAALFVTSAAPGTVAATLRILSIAAASAMRTLPAGVRRLAPAVCAVSSTMRPLPAAVRTIPAPVRPLSPMRTSLPRRIGSRQTFRHRAGHR